RYSELSGSARSRDPRPHEVTRAGQRDGGDGSIEPRRSAVVDRSRSRHLQRQDAGETDQTEHSNRRAGAVGGRALLEIITNVLLRTASGWSFRSALFESVSTNCERFSQCTILRS